MNIESTSITMLPIASIINNDGQIAGVPKNPRMITEERFTKLKERMKKDNLLGVFPLKVYLCGGQYVALGGNQRLRAAKALKMKEAACIIVPEDTDTDTLKEIVILENTHDGANDWDMLANEWDEVQLEDWGVDVFKYIENKDIESLLDTADFESLNDAARDKLNVQQVTFIFPKEEAEIVNRYIAEKSKRELTKQIVDLCR